MLLLSSRNSVLTPAIPLMPSAPNFSAGEMSLGGSCKRAFIQAQLALNSLERQFYAHHQLVCFARGASPFLDLFFDSLEFLKREVGVVRF